MSLGIYLWKVQSAWCIVGAQTVIDIIIYNNNLWQGFQHGMKII